MTKEQRAWGSYLWTIAVCVLAWEACNIPDPDDIHLAACLRAANAEAQACLDSVEAIYNENDDAAAYARTAQWCGSRLLDEVADCVDEVEQVLQ